MSKHKIKKNKKRKILFNKVSKIGKSIISRGMNGLVFIPQKMCIYVHLYTHLKKCRKYHVKYVEKVM